MEAFYKAVKAIIAKYENDARTDYMFDSEDSNEDYSDWEEWLDKIPALAEDEALLATLYHHYIDECGLSLEDAIDAFKYEVYENDLISDLIEAKDEADAYVAKFK